MKKGKARLLVWLLALTMTATTLSTPVFASEVNSMQTEEVKTTEEEVFKEKNVELGDEVTGYMVPLSDSSAQVCSASSGDTACPSPAEAQSKMYALKSQYPEGMHWTNENFYGWKGGIYSGGYGCAGFAFLLSDAAFGDLPARRIDTVTIDRLHSGDILRVNNDTHSVIVMEVYSDYIVIAEGNYNSSIHWGRTMTAAAVAASDYMLTRYPVGFFGEACTLSYDLNGASGSISAQLVDKGLASTISSVIPQRLGYKFKGWATSATATTAKYQPSSSITCSKDTTLYAVWEITQYPNFADTLPASKDIDIKVANDKVIYAYTPSETGTYVIESSGNVDTLLTLYNSDFVELEKDDDKGNNRNFKLIYILRAGNTYYMEYSIYDGSTGSFTVSLSLYSEPAHEHSLGRIEPGQDPTCTEDGYTESRYCECGEVLDEKQTIPALGHLFTAYYFNNDATSTSGVKETAYCDRGCGESITRELPFAQDVYVLSYNLNGASGEMSDQLIYSGSNTIISATIPERFGYDFIGWATSDTAVTAEYQPGDVIDVSHDIVLYAVWEQIQYTSLTDSLPASWVVSFENDESLFFTFSPEEGGDYVIKSSGTVDTVISLYDSDYDLIAADDDSGENHNFRLQQALKEGCTYYIELSAYGGDTGTFMLSLCKADDESDLPGYIDNTYPATVSVPNNGGDNTGKMMIMIPNKTAKYSFVSHGNKDSLISIYDEDGTEIANAYDSSCADGFLLRTVLESEKIYYIETGLKDNSTGSFYYNVFQSDYESVIPSSLPATVQMQFDENESEQYYYFEPATTAMYLFELKNLSEGDVIVYDETGEEMIPFDDCWRYDYDSDTSYLAVNLSAGQKYRVYVIQDYDTCSLFTIRVSVHTHSNAIYYPEIKATWTTEGRTAGYKCVCGHCMSGMKTLPKKTVAQPKVSSVSNTTSGVSVKWGAISGTEAYRVYYKVSGGSWTKAADTTSTSYTVPKSKLTSGKTYYFTVRCVTKDGKTLISSYDTTGKSLVYLASIKPTLTNVSSGITVKWTKVAGAAGYYVERKSGSGEYKKIKTITSGSTVSYTDKSIASNNGTSYTYRVRAYKGSVLGSYNGVSTYCLKVVSLTSLTNSGTKKMTAKWGKNSKASGYQIQYSTSSSFASGNNSITVSGGSTVSKVISSLKKGKTYYVRVRAYKKNSAGTKFYSAWSSKKSVKIRR